MSFILRGILVGALFIGINACASVPSEPIQNVHTIAAISIIGDEFDVISVGTTRFQNKHTTGEVSEWDQDSVIVDRIIAELRDRYTVFRQEPGENAFDFDFKNTSYGDRVFGRQFDFGPALKAFVEKNASGATIADNYLIVAPSRAVGSDLYRGNPEFSKRPANYADQFVA